MLNVVQILVMIFGGGAVAGGVSVGRWVTDERARRRKEKRAATLAPLEQKSYELRIAAQADEVLQDTIKTLRENYAELKKDFAQYRKDAEDRRKRDLEEYMRQRALDHEEMDRLHQQINDQNATIAQLRFELQGYHSGTAGP